MSKADTSPSAPRPSSSTPSIGTPPVFGRPSPSRSGEVTRRTRSASNRSLPAETGVWIVNTASDRTAVQASSSVRPDATSSRARSASRSAEWPSLRCQTGGREVELAQRADAADAEDELLVEAHLAAADVEDVGDRAVRVVVVGDVGVEQQDRHPADLGDPDGGVQVAAGERHADGERLAQPVERPQDRQPRELVVRVGVLLVAVRVDRLAEVALAVHQPHADERQGHVRGGLHVVAGEDAQAAGVDPEALVEAVLGAEVRDRALELVAVVAGEPVVRAVGHVGVELAQDLLVIGHECRVVEELVPGHGTGQDGDRVAVAGPCAGVDPAEHHPGRRVPRPPQVVGESTQPFELGRQVE